MASNKISINCKECDEEFDVLWETLEVEQTGSDERSMGAEVTYTGEVELDCPSCGKVNQVEYMATAYPENSPNFDETKVNGSVVEPGFGSCV